MSFLLDHEYEIPSKGIRNLVSLSTQANSMSMENTFFDWYFDNFLFIDYLSSKAGFAFSIFWSNLSFSFTGITIFLNLLIHSWSHLIHLNDTSFSFTCWAFLYFLSAFSFTSFAASCSLMWNLENCAIIGLLKSDIKGFFCCLNFLLFSTSRSTWTSTEKHVH